MKNDLRKKCDNLEGKKINFHTIFVSTNFLFIQFFENTNVSFMVPIKNKTKKLL